MRGPQRLKTNRARHLRQSDNDAESKLWSGIRNRQLNGFKFVRQLPIGPYFADFACREAHLVIELDGSQHAASHYDRRRDRFMSDDGCSVVRFANVAVFAEMDAVLETVVAILDGRLTEPVEAFDYRFVPAAPQPEGCPSP
jgi:very-short-patch-repair endonuclease